MTVLYVIAALVIGFAFLIVVLRAREAAHDRDLREAVRAYVTSRGGSVTFDDQGFFVKGPLGEGRETLTVLRIMCKPETRARWDTSIGFTLRKYMPDAFDDAFAKAAREDLAKALPAIQALSEEELRAKLRIRVRLQRSPSEGLSTCAEAVGERHEARVVLDGFDLAGLPKSARARLSENDEELFELALAATLGNPPDAAAGKAPSHVWLCRPDDIFDENPYLIACEGDGLVWIRAERETPEKAVSGLARTAMNSDSMKGVMFAWDGEALTDVTVVEHSIIGPTTPDYTLKLPAAITSALGIVAGPDGEIGVRR